MTDSQAPLPPAALGFHQVRALPPFRLQSVTSSELNVLPEETRMSKYSPLDEKFGAPTGSPENSDTVIPPTPVPETTVPPSAALAVPDWVSE